MKAVVLLDLDNTLLDDDKFIADFKRYLRRKLGTRNASRYLKLVQARKRQVGFADYLGALQRYAANRPQEENLVSIVRFLLAYPFSERLCRGAIRTLRALRRRGATTVLFTEGDIIFQNLKVDNSGLSAIFGSDVLVYSKKTGEEKDICRRYPRHVFYVIDDEAEVLSAIKRGWNCNPITILIANTKSRTPAGKTKPDYQVSVLSDLPTILKRHASNNFRKARHGQRPSPS